MCARGLGGTTGPQCWDLQQGKTLTGLRVIMGVSCGCTLNLWSQLLDALLPRVRKCSRNQEFSYLWRSKFTGQRDWIHILYATENKKKNKDKGFFFCINTLINRCVSIVDIYQKQLCFHSDFVWSIVLVLSSYTRQWKERWPLLILKWIWKTVSFKEMEYFKLVL